MSFRSILPDLTPAQREFVEALKAAGATQAEHAVPVDQATALPARELRTLVDSGIVREAAANRYYIYSRQLSIEMRMERTPAAPAPVRSPGRFLKAIVFWLLVLLLPIFLIQFCSPSA